MTANRLKAYVLLICAGVIQAFAICSPFTGLTRGWLSVLSLGIFLALLESNRSKSEPSNSEELKTLGDIKRKFTYSFIFSTSWLASSFWWIYISLYVYGGMPSVLATASVIILASGLALYYTSVCVLYTLFSKKMGWVLLSVLFGALWTLAELARAQWFTGFPWGAIGYAHLDDTLKLLAPYIGVYGIGFIAATIACLLAQIGTNLIGKLSAKRRWTEKWNVISALGLCVALLLIVAPNEGLIKLIEEKTQQNLRLTDNLSYTLLQGNIPQEIKFEAQGLSALSWYREQILAAKGQLIVTPETAVPLLKIDLPKGYWQEIKDHFKEKDHIKQALLIGIVGKEGKEYANSVVGINRNGEDFLYNKHHLVPFGEFIPAWFKWFTDLMHIPLGSFKRGELEQLPWKWEDQSYAVNICYEDVFGEEMAIPFNVENVEMPTVMINVSNIGWFGPFWAVEQHLNASRMRAIEMRRPMLRATNTGATAAIDHNGYVKNLLVKGEAAVLNGEIRGVVGPKTPYASWSGKYSLYPLWVGCLGILFLALGINFKISKAKIAKK